MSDYNKITNFTIKDSLPSGNTNKIIKGTELDNEFNAIQSAVSSKADANSPAFGGTPTAPTAASGTNNTQIATTAYVYNAPTINSPVFTGTPTAPTAEAGTSTTQLATTAFVTAAASAVLVDSSVTTSKLAANAVTPAKVSADTYAINISGNAATATSATSATSASSATTASKLSTTSGSAPVYGVRSFGTFGYSGGALTTFTSGNASISRTSTGRYQVTFATAMPSSSYTVVATLGNAAVGVSGTIVAIRGNTINSNGFEINVMGIDATYADKEYVHFQVVC